MRLKAFDYRYNANKALEGKKIFAVLVTIVFQILTGLFASVVDFFLTKYIGKIIFFDRVIIFILCMSIVYALFFISPISYGYQAISKKIYRNQKANVGDLFDGFSNYGRVFTLNLLLFVKTFLDSTSSTILLTKSNRLLSAASTTALSLRSISPCK